MSDYAVQTRDSLELSDYLRVLRERFWVIPLVVAIVLAVTLGITLTSTPQYRASTRLEYQTNNLEQAVFGSQVFTETNLDRKLQTGAVLMTLEPVAQAVKEELDSAKSTSELMDMVTSDTLSNTNVVDIIATGPDPAECAAVADAFAEQFILFRQNADRAAVAEARRLVDNELKSLSREDLASEYGASLREKYDTLRMVEAMQDGGFLIVQRASVPGKPFSPRPARDSVLAVVLGLVAGVGLAFLLDSLDKAVRDEKALEKALGAPVLTKVPWLAARKRDEPKTGRSAELVGFTKGPALLEAFRTLRSNLEFFVVEKQQTAWLLTSSEPREGKTTTAVNLALAMALSGKRVVVIDADLRRPMIHEYVGVSQSPGLSNLLAGATRVEDCMQLVKADEFIPPGTRRRQGEVGSGLIQRNIYVIASGPVPPNPAELLSSSRMGQLVKDLGGMCDCVLIDAPPILAVSDAVTLARHVDGVVVVARLGSTTRDQMNEVREIFERASTRVLGAVAFESKKTLASVGRRGYGYGYGYGQDEARASRRDDGVPKPPALPA